MLGNDFGQRGARLFGGGDPRIGGFARGERLDLRLARVCLSLRQRRGIGQAGQSRCHALLLIGRAAQALAGSGQRGIGDAPLGLLAGKARHGLRQRHLGVADGTIGFGDAGGEVGPDGFGFLMRRARAASSSPSRSIA